MLYSLSENFILLDEVLMFWSNFLFFLRKESDQLNLFLYHLLIVSDYTLYGYTARTFFMF